MLIFTERRKKKDGIHIYPLLLPCLCTYECMWQWNEERNFSFFFPSIFLRFLLLLYVNCLYQMTTKWYMYRCCIILSFYTIYIQLVTHIFSSMSVLSHKTYQILYFIFNSFVLASLLVCLRDWVANCFISVQLSIFFV